MKRLEETAKWFDGRGGATFLVHPMASESVIRHLNSNQYIRIYQNKLIRFLADGLYLPEVLRKIGTPDVYFSYGIPLFRDVGKINWFHVSNALTLTHDRHSMPFRRYFELQLLGLRQTRSLKNAQVVSAESTYALALLRAASGGDGASRKHVVIKNGCEDTLFYRPLIPRQIGIDEYAITIGTSPYKRLELALTVFDTLQRKHPQLKKFKIVGQRNQIPQSVMRDSRVEALGTGIDNEELSSMLERAKFYISASGIENSSIAASEAILLAQNVVLSDIPSHREAVANIRQMQLVVPGKGTFIEVRRAQCKDQVRPPSWGVVLEEMSNIATEVAGGRVQ